MDDLAVAKPVRLEVFPLGQTTSWKWRAVFPDGTVEEDETPILKKETAKAIARMCFPGTMLLVLK